MGLMPKFNIDAHGRHSPHVKRACLECRRRKTKCNGETNCGTCITHRTDCVYSSDPDGRSKTWKDRATHLARKLKAITGKLRFYKAQVRVHGGDVSPSISEPGSPVDEPSGQGVLSTPIDLTYTIGTSPYASYGHSIASVGKFADDADLYPTPARSSSHGGDGLSIKIPSENPAYDPVPEMQSSVLSTKTDEWSGLPPFVSSDPSTSYTSFSPSSHPSAKSPFANIDPARFLPLPISRDPSGRSSSRRTHSDVGHPSLVQSTSDCGISSSPSAQDAASPRVSIILREGEEPLAVNNTSILALAFNTEWSRTEYAAMLGPSLSYPAPSPVDAQLPHAAFAWNRYLPQPLRDRWNGVEHDTALTIYFEYASRWQPPIIGQLFLADMHSALGPASDGRTLHYSPGLHCAVLASAGALLPPTSVLAHPAVRASLLTAAREFIDADCEMNVRLVPSILGLIVLARYHLASAHGLRLAYSLITMACSLAVIGGLDLDTGSQADRLERQWCYVSLFNQSLEIAVHTGQNPIIPAPLHDAAQLQYHVNQLSMRDRTLETVLASETFIASSRLFVEMHSALAVGPGAHDRQLRLGVAERVETLLRGMQERGGQSDDAHLRLLNAAYLWALLVIRHPETTQPGSTREKYDAAASEVLNILSALVDTCGPSSVPAGVIHMAFAAGLAVLGRPDPTLAFQASLILSLAQNTHQCAGTFAAILRGRIAAVYNVSPDGHGQPAPSGAYMISSSIRPSGSVGIAVARAAAPSQMSAGGYPGDNFTGDFVQVGQDSSMMGSAQHQNTLSQGFSHSVQANIGASSNLYLHYPMQPW